MQCTLSGTLFVYQGEEIGQANLPRSWGIEEYKDIMSQEYFFEELDARRKKSGTQEPDMSDVWDGLQRKARDHARSPMQWNDKQHAGFTTAERPWMSVNEDYREWNVDSQLIQVIPGDSEEGSVLKFWREMLAFRKKNPACVSDRTARP